MTGTHPLLRPIAAGTLLLLLAATQGCTSRPTTRNRASSKQPSPVTASLDIASACRRPNAIASTERPVQIGQPGAATLGPLSFHPYPYQAGYPTKMLIHSERDQTKPLVLRGYRCTDRRTLRFSYSVDPELPTPPFTQQQMEARLGHPVANLKPLPANNEHHGYALFSSAGQWLLTLAQGSTTLGVVRIDVTQTRLFEQSTSPSA